MLSHLQLRVQARIGVSTIRVSGWVSHGLDSAEQLPYSTCWRRWYWHRACDALSKRWTL